MSPLGIAKIVGGPGSLGLLVVACAVGVALLYVWPKHKMVGRAWLLVTLLVYVILGCPFVARAIADSLPPAPSADLSSIRNVDELVVLGGDNEDGRVMATLNAWRTRTPGVVVVLGEQMFAQRIVDAGIPAARIRQDDGPRTTRAQIDWVKTERRAHPAGTAALIASRLQMPRVMELARMNGLDLLFLCSPLDHDPAADGIRAFLPSYGALEVSRDALYERAALAYYRSRGWIAEKP